jgi:plasmid stabilization system protein ParE
MAYKVIVNKRGGKRLISILDYLNENWGTAVTNDFLGKVEKILLLLEESPFVGAPSNKNPYVRRILITKHNRMYYKVNGDTVFVLNFFDTRQNPEKNKFE